MYLPECCIDVHMLRTNRCLAKFKFFLTEVQHFFQDGSLSSQVDNLILLLVTSDITPEDFFTRLQRMTDFPFEEFHCNIVKSGLPLLQDELRLIMPNDMNGLTSTSPQNPHSSSSQEYNSINGNGEVTPKLEVFDSDHNGIGELVSYFRKPGQGSLKRSCSNSLSLDPGETTMVSASTLHKLIRLSESMIPLLEELYDFSTDALTNGNNKDISDTESNDSINLQDPDVDLNGQDQSMSDGCTPQNESIELCKNCNRSSHFRCICQRVSYCTAYCQDRDREAHNRDFLCSSSYQQPVLIQRAILSDRNSHEQSMITIPNGDSNTMSTNSISPSIPIQPTSTSIFFQALPIMTTVSTTPICSITQPLK